MRTLGVVLLVAACSKPASILDRLPAGASVVLGMNRLGSEQELVEALKEVSQTAAGLVPACALATYAKIDSLAVALDLRAKPVTMALAVHGAAGLRKAVDDCLMQTLPGTLITHQGGLTRYQISTDLDRIPVRWIDDATLVAAGSSAGVLPDVGEPRSPLSRDPELGKLVGDIDMRSGSWLAADLATMPAEIRWPLPFARPVRVQAEVGAGGSKDVRGVLVFASPAEASEAADKIRALLQQAPAALAAAEPKVEISGEKVVLTLALGKLLAKTTGVAEDKVPAVAMGAAGVGFLAALAIPTYLKSGYKAKTAEAVMNVKMIFDRARSYYEENKKFPPSAAETPPIGTCCPGMCAPDARLWAGETWKALGFAMDNPHRYSYAYQSEGTSFTVTARGDLDCDGKYSTFEMMGEVKEGRVTGGAGQFRDNELE